MSGDKVFLLLLILFVIFGGNCYLVYLSKKRPNWAEHTLPKLLRMAGYFSKIKSPTFAVRDAEELSDLHQLMMRERKQVNNGR